MRLKLDQLGQHLEAGIKPVYLIAGDEDLLVLEAAAQVREAARKQGFEDREIFMVESGFDWNELQSASGSLSLFSTRRILDLRMPTGKPGREGGAWLRKFVTDPGDDVLLISSGHLKKDQLSGAWVKAIEGAGILIQCWPVDIQELPQWLDRRMRSRGLAPDATAARTLAERVEGNLLAAAQEVDKLVMIKGKGLVTVEDIQQMVADNSRFDIYRLVDASLCGQPGRALKMSQSLRAEGVTPILVIWAYARELRLLCQMRRLLNDGGNLDGFLRRSGVWQKRKQVLQQAMHRCGLEFWERALVACSRIDRMVKGQDSDDPWLAIERLAVKVAVAGKR